ncbi:MAG TPA: arsenic resistance N-acetyltransferase ArsN2 [Mucilaginibacter sp.]|nr:arsenic resistance N-acetyltransferase ArsN2 [Mucilaginibacter sp.]
MKIESAEKYRGLIAGLLKTEKLPADDLPASLENFAAAVEDDALTGVAGLEIYGDYGLLRSLAVDGNFRNQGIAGQLVKHIEAVAQARHLKAIYLLTETAPEYFTRKGYTTITRNDVPADVKRSSEFSHVCPQSAIVMCKIIPQSN